MVTARAVESIVNGLRPAACQGVTNGSNEGGGVNMARESHTREPPTHTLEPPPREGTQCLTGYSSVNETPTTTLVAEISQASPVHRRPIVKTRTLQARYRYSMAG